LSERILIVGGYGVFGGRLARRLCGDGDCEVVVAGRSLVKARAFCAEHGGTPATFDRDGDLDDQLRALAPAIVVDAAGPFQAYGEDPYRLAAAALRNGAHYLDLADDPDFVCGIDVLDATACAAGKTAVSGASSVPAISAAALDRLTADMSLVGIVESTILPGNRAPRGLSVMRAILSAAGQPLAVWRGGAMTTRAGWGDLAKIGIATASECIAPRYASPVAVPDLRLFPKRYGARTALFRAGLELATMHLGLWALTFAVRFGAVQRLTALAPLLKAIADRLERFGTDRGGMRVLAAGRTRDGAAVRRIWSVIAEGGDGPEIPTLPAYILVRRLLASDVEHGARTAAGEVDLDEVETQLATIATTTHIREVAAAPLFERVFGAAWPPLEAPWVRLHEIYDADTFIGESVVESGEGFAVRMSARTLRLPAPGTVPVTVSMTRIGDQERWCRTFGDSTFKTTLYRKSDDGPGTLRERFGPARFRMRLVEEDGTVHWHLEGWSVLGIALPLVLAPTSIASETLDETGRYRFAVRVSLWRLGVLFAYTGWLEPAPQV